MTEIDGQSGPAMVIVGAGECGARAAFALREAGWAGPITLIGEEHCTPYERPPLSKAAIGSAEHPAPTRICDAAALLSAGINFRPGVKAIDIDRQRQMVLLADGGRIPYHRLLIATGANPRRLPLVGPAASDVLYLRRHDDVVALREALRPGASIGVIGGGFIGLEIAAGAARRGCQVTVLESAPRLMGRAVPPEIAGLAAAHHISAGTQIWLGVDIVGLEHRGKKGLLTLADGRTLTLDAVVAGVGSVPETTLADKAGLDIENGIRVNDRLATSDPAIFAAGDCCSFPHALYDDRRIRLESWRNAQGQGAAAARNMLGADLPYTQVPWFWSDQLDLSLQIAGLPDAAARTIIRRRADGVEIRFGIGQDGRLVAACAIGFGNAVAKDIRLAEMLIQQRITPDATRLADPTHSLRQLLKDASLERTSR
jgi:3-phenylpropionate/trans-cinnamate dioxygenase ferredoxin reductase subunit